MLSVPLRPSLVAVIVVAPAPAAVTRPAALTVATAGLPLLQVTDRPTSGAPLESRGVVSAIYVPSERIAPPVADQTTATAAESPFDSRPYAEFALLGRVERE